LILITLIFILFMSNYLALDAFSFLYFLYFLGGFYWITLTIQYNI
jgi:hypothetical protein